MAARSPGGEKHFSPPGDRAAFFFIIEETQLRKADRTVGFSFASRTRHARRTKPKRDYS